MFVYGSDEKSTSEEITTKIGKELQPITVDGSKIKFIYGDENSIFHFDSELKFEEMSIYAEIVINDFKDYMYVLIPFDGLISSNAGENRIKHLLDIEQTNDVKNKNKIDFDKVLNDDGLIYDVFIKLINETTPLCKLQDKEDDCNMSLDDLLDKINEQGMSSLSEIEMKKLESYSK